MADAVEAALGLCPWLEVERVGDNVVARTELGRARRVLLAGHLDTVPPAGRQRRAAARGHHPLRGGGGRHEGRPGRLPPPGRQHRASRRCDVTWCFYVGEEVAREFNGLRRLWDDRPDLLAADAAILGEPTGGLVEAGCQGTLRVRVTADRADGPTPPGRTPAATPSTVWPGARPRWPVRGPTAGDRRMRVRRTAPGGGGRGRRGRQRGARPGRRGAQPPVRPGPRRWPRRSRRSGSCWPPTSSPADHVGAGRRRHRVHRRRSTTRCSPPWWRPPGAAAGQGRLDRRGLLLGARGAGGQLRPGGPAAGPHPGREST